RSPPRGHRFRPHAALQVALRPAPRRRSSLYATLREARVPLRRAHFCMSAFILDLTTLPSGLSRVEAEAEAGGLGLPPAEWTGRIRGSFQVEKSGDRITIRGTLEARARLECVRCLTPFELPMRVPFQLFAERSGTGSRRDEEALDRDAYMKFHDGRRPDLGSDARESLMIELPT